MELREVRAFRDRAEQRAIMLESWDNSRALQLFKQLTSTHPSIFLPRTLALRDRFLIDADGQPYARYDPGDNPLDVAEADIRKCVRSATEQGSYQRVGTIRARSNCSSS